MMSQGGQAYGRQGQHSEDACAQNEWRHFCAILLALELGGGCRGGGMLTQAVDRVDKTGP